MNTMTLDGWCKPEGASKSQPVGLVHFRVSERDHLRLEEAEENLEASHEPELMLDVNVEEMELQLPPNLGPLSDCKLRVYLNKENHRGHFHLVGHNASDGSLIYTNAVMVDQLG